MDIDTILGHAFLFLWSIGAIGIGIIGLFFRDQFVELNIQWSLKLYEMTHIPLFKTQAAQLQTEDWDFVILTGGLAIIIAGVATLLSLFNVAMRLP